MAKITIDLSKNTSMTHVFNKNCVLMYDGREYRAVSIDELFPEISNRYAQLVADVEKFKTETKNDIMNFFNRYTEQNSKLLPILEELLKEKK